MKLKKSVILYLLVVAIALTIGAVAYSQIVREQTPVNPDQIQDNPDAANDAASQTIEGPPMVIKDKVKF